MKNIPENLSTSHSRKFSVGDALAFATMGALLIWFFSPLLFFDKAIFFFDFSVDTYPSRYFQREVLLSGHIPFWNPYHYNGEPFLGAYITGVFYPLSLILLLGEFGFALNLFYVIHFFILGFSIYALTRRWKCSPEASLAAALTGVFSGFFLSITLNNNFFLAAVWFPLFLFCMDGWWDTGRTRYGLGAVVCLVFQILIGHPSTTLMTGGLAFFHAGFKIGKSKAFFKEWMLQGVTLLGFAILALLISAVQLLPTVFQMGHSVRHEGLDFDFHSRWSLTFAKVAGMALPFNFRDYMVQWTPMLEGLIPAIYMGIFPLVFLVSGLLFWKETAFRFWIIFTGVGLFFALGRNNPAYYYFYSVFPPIQYLRYPEKFYFISAMSMVFITAFGLDAWAEGLRSRKLKPAIAAGSIAVVSLLIGVLHIYFPERNGIPTLMLLLSFALVVWIYLRGMVTHSVFKILVIVFLLADLIPRNLQTPPMVNQSLYDSSPLLTNLIEEDEGPTRMYSGVLVQRNLHVQMDNSPNRLAGEIAVQEYMVPKVNMQYGMESPTGLSGAALEMKYTALWDFMFKTASPEKRLRMLKRSNTGYWVDLDQDTVFDGLSPIVNRKRLKVFEDELPRAFMVPGVRVVDPSLIPETYFDPDFDPLKEVLLEHPVPWKSRENFEGHVESVSYSPNRATVKVRSNGPGYLVLLDSWFPGWTATIDGQQVPIEKANYFFRAVQVMEGEHTVNFDYVPEGFDTGIKVSMAGLVLLLGFPVWNVLRQKKMRADI